MKVLDFVAIASLVIAFVMVPVTLFTWPGSRVRGQILSSSRVANVSMFTFMISVAVGMCASWISTQITQNFVIKELESVHDAYRISINGKTAPNGQQVLLALKSLQWTPPHHSDSTKRIGIDLFYDSHHLVLSLGRDSGDPREYWVFYPNYRITAMNEIGRIKTSIFDGY
jgi:hypothetical protein